MAGVTRHLWWGTLLTQGNHLPTWPYGPWEPACRRSGDDQHRRSDVEVKIYQAELADGPRPEISSR
jgi:hypothetical protein